MAAGSPPSKDVRLLRAVLARELETINEYEIMAEQAEDALIRDFFLHLAKEEKEHVGEAMALINERDSDQRRELDEAETGIEHFQHGTRTNSEGPAAGGTTTGAKAPATDPTTRFTVGSLRGQTGN